MRILLVTPRYYPNIGGVEYVVKSAALVSRLQWNSLSHFTAAKQSPPYATT
ncbi:MAG: hypothetical protein ACO2PM_11800 [Pyrobaculum sp.]|jgi:hypothetical protein